MSLCDRLQGGGCICRWCFCRYWWAA